MATRKKIDGYTVTFLLSRGGNALRIIRQEVSRLATEPKSAYGQAASLLKISTAAAEAQEAINEIEAIVRKAKE
jgi:hypothetical protein